MTILRIDTGDAYEAMEQANHNYEVEMVDMHLPDGRQVFQKKAVCRKDNGNCLGVVGPDYQPVQPVTLYELAYELMAETQAKITSVVNIKDGSIFGINLNISRQEYLPGDPVDLNFLLLASHNGAYGIIGRALSARLCCMNQLPSSQKMFNLKHTRFVEDRLTTAMKMLKYYNKEIDKFNDHMRELIRIKMAERKMVDWFRHLHPEPAKDSKRANSLLDNQTSMFVDLLSSGKGTDIPGVRGTAWHAMNGLTEYVNHHRSTRVRGGANEEDVKFEALNFGSGAALMVKGMNRLLEYKIQP